jgi:hypothetical protein
MGIGSGMGIGRLVGVGMGAATGVGRLMAEIGARTVAATEATFAAWFTSPLTTDAWSGAAAAGTVPVGGTATLAPSDVTAGGLARSMWAGGTAGLAMPSIALADTPAVTTIPTLMSCSTAAPEVRWVFPNDLPHNHAISP